MGAKWLPEAGHTDDSQAARGELFSFPLVVLSLHPCKYRAQTQFYDYGDVYRTICKQHNRRSSFSITRESGDKVAATVGYEDNNVDY